MKEYEAPTIEILMFDQLQFSFAEGVVASSLEETPDEEV